MKPIRAILIGLSVLAYAGIVARGQSLFPLGSTDTTNVQAPDVVAVQQQRGELKRRIEQLRMQSNQATDQAREADQNAANEDRLAQSGPAWARVTHQLAAVAFRKIAQQNREQARQRLVEAQELERQVDALGSRASAPAPITLASNTGHSTPIGDQSAGLYQTVSVQDMVKMVQAAGYDTETDSEDDVKFKVNGVKTWIHLYGCDHSEQCKSFSYRIAFSDTGVPAELLNEYNFKKRWAHVYLNQRGSPCMDWDVGLDGGVTHQYLVRTLPMWRDLIATFVTSLSRKAVP